VELLQSVGIPPARSPALADLLTNTIGAAVGAALQCGWCRVLYPDRAWSVPLALGWASGAAVVFLLTAVAAGPRGTAGPARYAPSHFDYAPGYGWYGGEPSWAEVGEARFAHRGTGPIVVQASAEPEAVQLRVQVRGRDAAPIVRAIVYVHTAAESSAVVMLAQRENDAVLRVTRRAWDLGLRMPDWRIAGAFAGAPDAERLLVGEARRDRLTVGYMEGDVMRSSTLSLTPSIGWSMLQGVVGHGSPLAVVMLSAWLAVLLLPIGWYAARSARPRATALAGVSLVGIVWLALAANGWSAASAPIEWGLLVLWVGLGLLAGRRWVAARGHGRL
jgi:hypothetical protein